MVMSAGLALTVLPRADGSGIGRSNGGMLVNRIETAEGYMLPLGGPEFWLQRASDLSAEIEQTISRLQTTAPPAAAPHYDAALSALGGLNGLDQKAKCTILPMANASASCNKLYSLYSMARNLPKLYES